MLSCLCISYTNPIFIISFANVFSCFVGCHFVLLMSSFAEQELKFNQVPFVSFCFCFLCFSRQIQENIAIVYVKEYSACILFQEFYVLQSYIWLHIQSHTQSLKSVKNLTYRYLIHFLNMLLENECSNFIFCMQLSSLPNRTY